MSLSELRKKSSSNFEKLNKEINNLKSGGGGSKDPNEDLFWKPDADKAGNGYAVIRFLPAPSGEDIPFVRIYDHGFQGPGGWYIEKSRTTIGDKDPVGELNSKLWNSGDQETARKQKRRLSYYSNIYVIKDPANPANEGKVFLFKYGKKIFDKINDIMNPQFEDEKPINPFDLWEGANFRLKIRMVEGYRNYDKSEFESVATLSDDDDELERIYKGAHSLQQFLAPKNFKSYEELQTKLNRVLGLSGSNASGGSRTSQRSIVDDEEDTLPPPTRKEAKPAVEPAPWKTDEDDDDLDFLKRLAEDD
jgi:hypothetical protein